MAARKRFRNKAAMKAYSSFIVAAKAKEAELKPLAALPKNHADFVYAKVLTKEDTNGRIVKGDCRAANMVLMTFADHVQAHALLAEVYEGHSGLLAANLLMSGLIAKGNLPGLLVQQTLANGRHITQQPGHGDRMRLIAQNKIADGTFSLTQPETRLANAAVTSKLQSQLIVDGVHNFVSPEGRKASSERGKQASAKADFWLHTPKPKQRLKPPWLLRLPMVRILLRLGINASIAAKRVTAPLCSLGISTTACSTLTTSASLVNRSDNASIKETFHDADKRLQLA